MIASSTCRRFAAHAKLAMPGLPGVRDASWSSRSSISRCRFAARRHRRHAGWLRQASPKLVVATSEHWWEDEEEFDALTDIVTPKNVLLVAAPADPAGEGAAAALAALRQALAQVVLHSAMAAEGELQFAQRLWEGRDGPPYFHKVRKRPALDAAGTELQAAADVWQELLSQNWRVELDAGLGVEAPGSEGVLLVCSAAAVQRLLEAAGAGAAGGSMQPGAVAVVHAAGGADARLVLSPQQAAELADLQEVMRS